MGTAAAIAALYLYGNPSAGPSSGKAHNIRPPPIQIENYEKDVQEQDTSPVVSSPNDFSIKLPTTPFLTDAGLSTSRPTSPGQPRSASGRSSNGGGYFAKHG